MKHGSDWDIEGFWFGATGALYISCKKIGISIDFSEGLHGYDIGINAWKKEGKNGWLARDSEVIVKDVIIPMPKEVLNILVEKVRREIVIKK